MTLLSVTSNEPADDGQNNSCSGEVIVYVPLNKGEYGPSIDDGPLYDSTLP